MKNKMIKRFALALAVWLAVSLCGCAASGNPAGTSETDTDAVTTAAGAASADTADAVAGDYFSNSDIKDVTGETPDAVITLEGASGTISDTTRGASGSTVTITAKGVYRVSGTAENVTIIVRDTTKSGNIYLVLDGVTMTNSDLPCILVESADKVIIQCAGENSLTYTAASAEADGAIYARDDVTLNGTGSLTVASSLHGIVGCDDVKITGGTLTVRADSIGIKANDSVRIGGGSVSIVSGHDGVQVDSDDGSGCFYMNGGALTIHFMPYNHGTAVDMHYTIVQAFGARYQKHADDVLIFVNTVVGAQAQPVALNLNQFLAYETGMPAAPMTYRPQPEAQPVQQPSAPPKRFCTNCGTPISPGAQFCTKCGKKL